MSHRISATGEASILTHRACPAFAPCSACRQRERQCSKRAPAVLRWKLLQRRQGCVMRAAPPGPHSGPTQCPRCSSHGAARRNQTADRPSASVKLDAACCSTAHWVLVDYTLIQEHHANCSLGFRDGCTTKNGPLHHILLRKSPV